MARSVLHAIENADAQPGRRWQPQFQGPQVVLVDGHGFVVSEDLNPAKSRILAQLLIANGITAPAKVQQAFTANW